MGAQASRPVSTAVKTNIDSFIKTNKIAVISKSWCPFCSKAKNALNTVVSPDQYQVLEIENHQDMNDIQNYMAEKTGGRSVPRVFIDGKFVGGGDDMVRLAQNGKLAELVK